MSSSGMGNPERRQRFGEEIMSSVLDMLSLRYLGEI